MLGPPILTYTHLFLKGGHEVIVAKWEFRRMVEPLWLLFEGTKSTPTISGAPYLDQMMLALEKDMAFPGAFLARALPKWHAPSKQSCAGDLTTSGRSRLGPWTFEPKKQSERPPCGNHGDPQKRGMLLFREMSHLTPGIRFGHGLC